MRYYGHANGDLSKFSADSTEEVLSEPTHSFEVDEAVRLGSVEKAILLKEIRRMAVYKVRAGKEPWVFYSGKMLSEKFPYLPQRSVERWMRELEESGELVSSIKNKMRYDKTKSYTLPQFKSIVAQNGEWSAQNGEPIPPLSTPITNTVANAKEFVIQKDTSDSDKPVRTSGGKKTTPAMLEVFEVFDDNPDRKMWKLIEVERVAAKTLSETYSIEELTKLYKLVKKNRDDQFCPAIYKPTQMLTKIPSMNRFLKSL
jgi:hypothetical protein